MKFTLFSEGPINDEEKFSITLQQKVKEKGNVVYGHVGEFELSGRELKQMLAMFDALFSRPAELPTFDPQLDESIEAPENIHLTEGFDNPKAVEDGNKRL